MRQELSRSSAPSSVDHPTVSAGVVVVGAAAGDAPPAPEAATSSSSAAAPSSSIGAGLVVGVDMSDPRTRLRIERYKEERRSYLREKYKSESFRSDHKDDAVIVRLKQKAGSPTRPDDALEHALEHALEPA